MGAPAGPEDAPVTEGRQAADAPFADQYLREYAPLFANHGKMREVRTVVEAVAGTNAVILIRGESGVGKDVVARAIHAASARHARPFVKVNCAALPADLLETELFGHEKGAFTGAYRQKLGKFEDANTGTIFLDEIGDLPRALQAKLLHVLQDFEFSRVGGRELIRVDTRMIAATNRDLEAALATGDFRQDLYYRLNVVEIRVPPLRERKDEIAAMAALFLSRFNRQYHRSVDLSPEILALFEQYSWPGNVRELDNIVRRLVLLGNDHQVRAELARALPTSSPAANGGGPTPAVAAEAPLGLREIARRAAREAERRALLEVLERVRWNRTEAARILQISYRTLLTKIAECGL
jgi:two-component system response regulator AtoC